MVEQRAVAVRRGLQLLQVRGEGADVVRVDLAEPGELLVVVLVVRQGVVRIVDTDGREGPVAGLATEGERDHAREVGLVGQDLEIDHERRVCLEVLRHADGPVRDRELLRAVVLLGPVNAPLGFANRFQVLVHPAAVLGAEIRMQATNLVGDRVEQAAIHPHLAQPIGGAVAVAEQALEHGARIPLHRVRRRRRPPRDGVHVGATVAGVAVAHDVRRVEGELE